MYKFKWIHNLIDYISQIKLLYISYNIQTLEPTLNTLNYRQN